MEYLWVYLTLAEAYQGLGRTSDEERLGPKIESEATEFGKGSYLDQKAKLKAAMDEFERGGRSGDVDGALDDQPAIPARPFRQIIIPV